MRIPVLLVAALLMSGCISAMASEGLPDPAARQAPAGPGAGTPAAHGAPQRTETPVKVELGTDGYVASRDVTVRNDFGGAPATRVRLATENGNVRAGAWPSGGYQLAAHLEGRGKTEQEARAALDTLAVLNQDSLAGSLLDLGLQVRFNDPPTPLPTPVPIPVDTSSGLQRSASIVASLPAGPAEDLGAQTTNGEVAVAGLHGARLAAQSTNGELAIAGAWDKAELRTTNGGVHLDALVNDLEARSTNGNLGGTVESQRSCKQSLATTNGSVKLAIKDRGHGYDLSGRTTNGRVSIDVAGAHAEGKDRQEARTPGFEGEAVQVVLDATSTNGNVELRTA
ncbi:MAG: hypothetical protein QOI63_335 [Thermoplasmata archaeon]|nr:hypothetical protein [Thermoplasmata archaeon]